MKTFTLIITSKNKNSACEFLEFFNTNKIFNLNSIKKYFQKKNYKKKITLLKSPHVNSRTKEQFESEIFKKQITIKTLENLKYFLIFKKINATLFPDLCIKVKYNLNKKSKKKLGLVIFNPSNFIMGKYNNNKYESVSSKKKQKLYLTEKVGIFIKIIDIYADI